MKPDFGSTSCGSLRYIILSFLRASTMGVMLSNLSLLVNEQSWFPAQIYSGAILARLEKKYEVN